ncbi:MAG: MBL fold metallo-hydrolase [Candidatus Spyradocola sp.]|jgi:N-acyl homoserine lactone hydrolase
MYTFHILTIGHLSRNKFWGESNDQAYRKPLATSTLLLGEGEVIVADPSLPEAEMREALLNAAGLSLEDVTLVFSTHNHLDHHVDPLCFPHARWLMPAVDLSYLHEHWAEHKRSFPGDDFDVVEHCESAGSEIAPGLRVVPLPGHTPGTSGLAFDAPEGRVLLTGDAVMTREFYKAGEPYFFGWDNDLAKKTIAALRGTADVIIPGHGEAFLARAWE